MLQRRLQDIPRTSEGQHVQGCPKLLPRLQYSYSIWWMSSMIVTLMMKTLNLGIILIHPPNDPTWQEEKYHPKEWRCWRNTIKWSVCLYGMNNGSLQNLSASELSHGLGAFRDGMLSQLSWQNQTHCGLNLPRGDCRLLVIPCKTGSLLRKLLKDIIDERVHNAHSLRRDTGIRMHL